MKDRRTIILILVLRGVSIPSSRGWSWWMNSRFKCFIFSLPEFQVFSVISSRSFIFSFSRRSKKIIARLQSCSFSSFMLPQSSSSGGSSWWFIKDFIHSRSVHQDSCWRSSSILHHAFRNVIPSPLSFEVVLCHSWQFRFMVHDSQVVKNEIF